MLSSIVHGLWLFPQESISLPSVFPWVESLRSSSRQSMHLVFDLPSSLFSLLVCVWRFFWGFLLSSIHCMQPLPILFFSWWCNHFLVAMSLLPVMNECDVISETSRLPFPDGLLDLRLLCKYIFYQTISFWNGLSWASRASLLASTLNSLRKTRAHFLIKWLWSWECLWV